MDSFSKELDAELLPVLFPDFPEQKFGALVERVRASIIQGIEKNDWLSDKTKAAAIRKIKYARLQLVKPQTNAEWNFNPPAEYSPDKPHQNSKILVNNLIKKTIRELHYPRDKNRWEIGPLTVNAYYTPSDNKFVLAQGILQYPFYDPELPEYANLGASGMVAAHELGHAIDDQGSKYDDRGRLRQWMTDDERQEFQQRGAKLVEQFEKAGHDGELTLGENIADLVGLSFAYRAAFPTNTGTKKEKQAFFVQYARNWCTVIRPKFRQLLLKTDPHAMGPARVNEQVKHQSGFQEAFGCVAGDPMVLPPEQRVRIW
jgi:putative endopeptidase